MNGISVVVCVFVGFRGARVSLILRVFAVLQCLNYMSIIVAGLVLASAARPGGAGRQHCAGHRLLQAAHVVRRRTLFSFSLFDRKHFAPWPPANQVIIYLNIVLQATNTHTRHFRPNLLARSRAHF